MMAIWRRDGRDWRPLPPSSFPDEQTLESLIEETPHLLPLAGSPQLTIVGRQVALGSLYADLIAVEPTGRLVVIEVKLARNSEARRAIGAQALAYAAALHRTQPEVLERDVLGRYLREHSHERLADAVVVTLQGTDFDPEDFDRGLAESLSEGRFRLVLVLDDAPAELVRLVGFLEARTDGLLVDLVTVAAYDIGGTQALVPQRVDPERTAPSPRPAPRAVSGTGGWLAAGAGGFEAAIARAPTEQQLLLRRLSGRARASTACAPVHLSRLDWQAYPIGATARAGSGFRHDLQRHAHRGARLSHTLPQCLRAAGAAGAGAHGGADPGGQGKLDLSA